MNFGVMVGLVNKFGENRLHLCHANIQIEHSHRHDDMEFMILTDEELAKFSDYPVTPGITARFMRTDQQTMEQRRKPHFACKHCILNPRKCTVACGGDPVSPGPRIVAIGGAKASSDGEASKLEKKSRAFNFDGLRCHLKEK